MSEYATELSINKALTLPLQSTPCESLDRLRRAAHDIRSPVAVMRMLYNEFAITMPHNKRNLLQLAFERMDAIVSDLLNTGELSATIPQKNVFDVQSTILSIYAEKSFLFSQHNVHLNVSKNLNELRTYACESELKRTLSNIIQNSFEALSTGGSISIEAQILSGFICIDIIDDGRGIANELIPKIFDKGFSQKPNGFGLGLYYAKKSIERMQGRIEVISEVNKGTSFRIILPLAT